MNLAFNYQHRDEESGLKAVPKVESIVRRKRLAFQDALFDMESDQFLVPLFNAGSASRGGAERGALNFTLADWHKFAEKYFRNNENFLDKARQQEDLAAIFNKTMNQAVKKWPEIAAQGYQWTDFCGAIQKHMLNLAGVMSLTNELSETITNWFNAYRQEQEYQIKYGERDRLAAEALQKHQDLAYLKTIGQDTNQVQGDIRIRIANINNELTKLPVHPEHKPVFTAETPQARAAVPMTKTGHTPSAWAQYAKNKPAVVEEPKKVTGWRAAAKKIPLIGRWF